MFVPARRLPVTTNYRSASAIVHVGNALMARLGVPGKAHSARPGSVLVADLAEFEPTGAEKERHRGDSLTPAIVRLVRNVTAAGRRWLCLVAGMASHGSSITATVEAALSTDRWTAS